MQTTSPDARRTVFALTRMKPRRRGFIPCDPGKRTTHPHVLVAEISHSAVAEPAAIADAAGRVRGERLDQVEFHGAVSQAVRVRRLLRWRAASCTCSSPLPRKGGQGSGAGPVAFESSFGLLGDVHGPFGARMATGTTVTGLWSPRVSDRPAQHHECGPVLHPVGPCGRGVRGPGEQSHLLCIRLPAIRMTMHTFSLEDRRIACGVLGEGGCRQGGAGSLGVFDGRVRCTGRGGLSLPPARMRQSRTRRSGMPSCTVQSD